MESFLIKDKNRTTAAFFVPAKWLQVGGASLLLSGEFRTDEIETAIVQVGAEKTHAISASLQGCCTSHGLTAAKP